MTTIIVNGIETEVPAGAVAYKYADPTEGARWVYSAGEADEIAAEDPSLIVRVPDADDADEKFAVWKRQDTGVLLLAFSHPCAKEFVGKVADGSEVIFIGKLAECEEMVRAGNEGKELDFESSLFQPIER